jgi:hypothetical protein
VAKRTEIKTVVSLTPTEFRHLVSLGALIQEKDVLVTITNASKSGIGVGTTVKVGDTEIDITDYGTW